MTQEGTNDSKNLNNNKIAKPLILFIVIFIIFTSIFPILYLLEVDTGSYFIYWLIGEFILIPIMLLVLKMY